jgi:hypothetical protein
MPAQTTTTPYGFKATTGAELQSHVAGGAVPSSPAVANGAVDIYSEDDNVYAYSLG